MISIALRWAIVQLAGHRILAPIIKVRVLVAQPIRPYRLVGPGQRPFTPSTGVRIPLGTPNEVKGLHENATLFCLYVGQIYPLSASTEFFILFFSWVVQSRDCPPLKADAASGPCKAGSATAHSTACASYRNPLECAQLYGYRQAPMDSVSSYRIWA